MGKYNLGKSTTKVQEKITKEGLYINEAKADPVVKNILKEFIGHSIHISLLQKNIMIFLL